MSITMSSITLFLTQDIFFTFSFDASFLLTGLPFPTTTHNPRTPQRSAPPKLRSRDRSTSRLRRCSTPPPLPKSAVLPLHTPKHSQSLTTPQPPVSRQRSLPQQHTSSTPVANGGTTNGPLQDFDSTPAIAELTQQINQTRALNVELRNQLSEHASSATEVDATLSAELNNVREAKRVEDVARGELKARTKTLEESRRAAEAGKRDAERRLRTTQKAKAEAGTRIERLGEEIRALEAQVQQDEVAVRVTAEAATQEELDIRARVKQRQREVGVAEEVVTALNVRVRELEDSIEHERIALAAAREKAQALQREQDSHKYDTIPEQPLDTWETISTSESSLTTSALEQRMGYEVLDPFPTPLEKDSDRGRERSGSGSVSTRSSPHLCALPAAPSINVAYATPSQAHPNGMSEPRPRLPKGYSIFDEDLASLSNPNPIHGAKFSPFGDSDVANGNHTLSLIPKGLIQPPDGMPSSAVIEEIGAPGDMLTRRQSDNETFFDRDWRRRPSVSAVGSESHRHVFPRVDDGTMEVFEPFGIRPRSRHRMTSDPVDVPGVWLSRTNSDPAAVQQQDTQTRWWRGPDKERRSTVDGTESRRGLNPDAKVFSFSAKPLFGVPAAPAFNCLNASTSDNPVSGAGSSSDRPNGATTSSSTPGFFSGLAMRAFAPSPAEREALQRALGGSTNASFERLPSLSEVGSMPTSPALNHVPAHPAASSNPPGMPWFDIGLGPGAGRNWLRELGASMPRPSNIKFSPWGDGDGDGIEADK